MRRFGFRRLLLDSNLLVLLVVGIVNPARIRQFKRTKAYGRSDFDLLVGIVDTALAIYTTPHILTEVSNLTNLPCAEGEAARRVLRERIMRSHELHVPGATACSEAVFERLGLTGAAILSVARENSLAVITVDVGLYLALENEGITCLNFAHLQREVLRSASERET